MIKYKVVLQTKLILKQEYWVQIPAVSFMSGVSFKQVSRPHFLSVFIYKMGILIDKYELTE